jgi:hypothetical protein
VEGRTEDAEMPFEGPLCVSQFSIVVTKYLKQQGFIWAHGFSPRSAGSIALRPVARRKIMVEGHGKTKPLSSWQAEKGWNNLEMRVEGGRIYPSETCL